MEKNAVYKRYDKNLFDALYDDLKASQTLLSPYATLDKFAVRRCAEKFHVARPNFIKDIERIINCRFYNRYVDKTQVFSLYHNDDISRRSLHVQLVSRIARNIGRMLKLNQDLIEAIALGHDLGHPPFGHLGEHFLSDILYEQTGRYFNHNVQSVRILNNILRLNLTLQTLDGILSHNGEKVIGEYYPIPYTQDNVEEKFATFYDKVELCVKQPYYKNTLVPSTLEGCVVRFADIIAYLGKDRQDATILGIECADSFDKNELLGASNAEFIANLIADIVTNSYNKNYIMLNDDYAKALDYEMGVNYKKIYKPQDKAVPVEHINNLYCKLFNKLYADLKSENQNSPVYKHHLYKIYAGYKNTKEMLENYLKEDKFKIIVDYIASMTDDYFLEICNNFFADAADINYHCYFMDY